MAGSRKDDVVLYTLQSFVGNNINETVFTERQKEAMQRLNDLKEEKFYELCNDISNEIHRRSGAPYDLKNKMCKKFAMLSDENFKSLVVDILVVFYNKNPDKKPQEMSVFMENLTTLIEDLKTESRNESFVENLKKLNFFSKIKEYINYTNSFNIDPEIAELMKSSLDKELEKDGDHLLEVLLFPTILLDRIQESMVLKCASTDINTRFSISKQIILNSLKTNNTRAIKEELAKIFRMLIFNSEIPSNKIVCFEDEIKSIIESLEIIRSDLKNEAPADINSLYEKLSFSINSIVDKAEHKNFSKEKSTLLQIHKISLEALNSTPTKLESFRIVLDFAKEFRNILKSLPAPENICK